MENQLYSFDYLMPTKVIFGNGKINSIGQEVAGIGKKAMLVTGKTSAKKYGYTDKITGILSSNKVETVLYDEIEPNPDRKDINRGAEIAREEECDLIIGLGGGSVLDAAKGISLVVTNEEDVWNYVEGKEPKKEGLPIIAVPTTSGTGSEVTPYAVVSDKAKSKKDGFGSIYIFPKVSILDPELTLSLSHHYTISTGLDALAHAIESYTSSLANKMSDIFALEAIKILAKNLGIVSKEGKNVAARENMLYGNMIAGIALANADLTIAHVIGTAIGAIYDTDHGLTVGLVLPEVMKYNCMADPKKNALISEALGEDITSISIEDAARRSSIALKKLLENIDYPSGLKEIGVGMNDVIIDLCVKPSLTDSNPVNIGKKEIREIMEKSM